jgi:hypothetical protein
LSEASSVMDCSVLPRPMSVLALTRSEGVGIGGVVGLSVR